MTQTSPEQGAAAAWNIKQVGGMGLICLFFGLTIGYLFRGSQPATPPSAPVTQGSPQNPHAVSPGMQMPSLEQMKQMADKKAEPLMEKLKTDPANSTLLFQIGNIYKATHQFQEAIGFYDRALKSDAKNVSLRTEMATCMYYTGDVDGAISQLQQALQYRPRDPNSLFNLGVIRLRGKHDSKGAVDAWENLLKSNPQLSPDRKAQVQKLIEEARSQAKS